MDHVADTLKIQFLAVRKLIFQIGDAVNSRSYVVIIPTIVGAVVGASIVVVSSHV